MFPTNQKDPLIDVPSKHEFDRAALVRYMNEHVEGCRSLSSFKQVKKFATGQSNPTFLLTVPGAPQLAQTCKLHCTVLARRGAWAPWEQPQHLCFVASTRRL